MSSSRSLRGYALASTLWLVVLLTGIAAGYHAHARVEARLLTAAIHRAQAEALAEAGIWLAVHDHFTGGAAASDRVPRATRMLDVDGAAVAVTIRDASGLINLNGAPPELLAALLGASSGLEAAERATVVDSILDWRDSDSARRPAGAEDAEYAAANAPYGAKDAPFATIDELKLVHGMTAAAYRAIAPALTVYGDHARVNVAAAPPGVLAVMPRDALATSGSGDSFDQRFVQQTGEGIYIVLAAAAVGTFTGHVAAAVRYAPGEQRVVQVLAWSNSPAAAGTLGREVTTHGP